MEEPDKVPSGFLVSNIRQVAANAQAGKPTIVTFMGKPICAVVSLDDLTALQMVHKLLEERQKSESKRSPRHLTEQAVMDGAIDPPDSNVTRFPGFSR